MPHGTSAVGDIEAHLTYTTRLSKLIVSGNGIYYTAWHLLVTYLKIVL